MSGEFAAVVYRLNGPPDADGDVILPGAIRDGTRVVVSVFNHDTQLFPGAEPAGEARLYEEGEVVVARGKAFDTPRGRQLRAILVEGGENQQWSIAFRVVSARAPTPEERARWPRVKRIIERWQPLEISPVTLGACGPACRTVAAKLSPCGCHDNKPADQALKELARFERARFLLLEGDIRRAKESPRPAQIAAEHEIPSCEVSRERRRAALEGIALAQSALDVEDETCVPLIKWFAKDAPAGLAGFYRRQDDTVWLRDGYDLADCAAIAAHEFAHAMGKDEEDALRLEELVKLAYTSGAKLLPGRSYEWQNMRGVKPGDIVVHPETLKAEQRTGRLEWREV